jgi:hypothetical protein
MRSNFVMHHSDTVMMDYDYTQHPDVIFHCFEWFVLQRINVSYSDASGTEGIFIKYTNILPSFVFVNVVVNFHFISKFDI